MKGRRRNRDARSRKIGTLRREGYPPAQAAAIAYREYGENPRRYPRRYPPDELTYAERDLIRPIARATYLAPLLDMVRLASEFAVASGAMDAEDMDYFFAEPLRKMAAMARENSIRVSWPHRP